MSDFALGADLSSGQGQYGDSATAILQDFPSSDLGRKVMKDRSDAISMVNAQRGAMKQDFAFYHGHQWDDVDRLRMEQLKRPALVFNVIKSVVDAVSGMERLNRMSVRYVTRALDSPHDEDLAGDLATEARETVLDLADGDRSRSRALLDTGIGGLGVVEVRVDYEKDIDGRVVVERIDPFQFLWDQNAVAENLIDAQWVGRERNIPRKLFIKFWGEQQLQMIDAAAPEWDERNVGRYELVTPYYSRQNERANPLVNQNFMSKGIPVIQYQWRDYQTVYRFLDPQTPDHLTELDEKAWKSLGKKYEVLGMPLPNAVRQQRPVYKQVYVSRGVQLEDPTTLPGNYFSLLPITGQYDTETKTWYGIIRPLLDAQRVRNKSISGALGQSLTNAKGGVIYKTTAFADPIAAKNEWAKADAWIEANDTANIATDIVQRTPASIPAELPMFFKVSTEEVTRISGINDEMVSVAQGQTQTGTSRQRVQQSLAVLGWYFDAISAHMRTEARVILEFIREFWTRGQLIQVGGNVNGRAIPLLRSGLPMDYELVLDESVKHNPNLKMQIWQDLLPIMPALMRFGFGPFLLTALKYSPFPTQVVDELQKLAQQQPPQPPGGKGRGKPQDPQEQQAKVAKLAADRQKTLAEARAIDQDAKLQVAKFAVDALSKGQRAHHQQDLAQHKKRQDALKLLEILRNKGDSGNMPPTPGGIPHE